MMHFLTMRLRPTHPAHKTGESESDRETAVARWKRERAQLFASDSPAPGIQEVDSNGRLCDSDNARGEQTTRSRRTFPRVILRIGDIIRVGEASDASKLRNGDSSSSQLPTVSRDATAGATQDSEVARRRDILSTQDLPRAKPLPNNPHPFIPTTLQRELQRYTMTGIARLATTQTVYVRQLQWFKRDNVWRGEWQWIPQLPSDGSSAATPRTGSRGDNPTAGHSIPPEIFLHIALLEVADGVRSRGLANMALTCHVWFAICAPLLYSSACVTNARLDAFTRSIRVSHSYIREHATAVALRGPRSWSFYPRLTHLLPNLTHLHFVEPDGVHAPSYLPSLLHTLSISSKAFEQIQTLQLTRCRFEESRDLVVLISSFPSLVTAELRRCSYAEPSLDALRSRSDTLRKVTFSECEAICPFALLWTRPTASPTSGFYGLEHTEVEMSVAPVLRQVHRASRDLQFELRVDETSYAQTWVVWLRTAGLHIEFHASRFPLVDHPTQDDHWGPAHIRHIVFRCSSDADSNHRLTSSDSHFVEDGVRRMDPFLARLSHLQTVKFETQRSRTESDVLVSQLTMIKPKIRRSTCRQAREYAQKMKKTVDAKSKPRATPRSIPVSPLWYLAEFDDESKTWIAPESSPIKTRDLSISDASEDTAVSIQLHGGHSSSTVDIADAMGLEQLEIPPVSAQPVSQHPT